MGNQFSGKPIEAIAHAVFPELVLLLRGGHGNFKTHHWRVHLLAALATRNDDGAGDGIHQLPDMAVTARFIPKVAIYEQGTIP